MSSISPGPVLPEERIERFLFSPVHLDKKGKLLPAIFSQAFKDGCSIQRMDRVSDGELEAFVGKFLAGNVKRVWVGTVGTAASKIRSISIDRRRGFAIYDTAETDNTAHGEMFAAYPVQEADQLELIAKLFAAFGNGEVTSPVEFRDGKVWNALADDVRGRKAPAPTGIKATAAP